MFVLLVMLLIATITLGVMNLIAADQSAGIHELQAVQVFNVAEAGVQYAIGRLQASGANSYAGQTLTITNGTTTLGTAVIAVNCIDTGNAPPCSGTWAGYRRIVSTGSLATGSPARTVVAVIQGYGLAGSPYALCAASTLTANATATIFGDIGSNSAITLATGATVHGDVGLPAQYPGIANANGTITCATSCAAQVLGGATSNVAGTVCPSLTTGPYTPSSTPLHVTNSGYTMNSVTGYTWGDVIVDGGNCNPGSKGLATLRIQAGAAGTTTVVNVNSLTFDDCGRLMILGAGNVDLRIGATAGTGLSVGQESHIGVLSTDTWAIAAPAPASQLEVEVNSPSTCSTNCAVDIRSSDTRGVAAGVFLVPNGEIRVGSFEQMHGAIVANTITLNSTVAYTYDTTAGSGGSTFSTFNNLRSWRDQ
jgi:Tfp pilus assembly protein PilX